jgi:type IV secretory pathway TrbF-like protein
MGDPELLKPEPYHEDNDQLKILAGKIVYRGLNRNLRATIRIQSRVIYVLLSLVIIFGCWVIYQSNKSTMVPFLVKENASGKTEYVGVIKKASSLPNNDSVKQYFIERFIKDARTIPYDPKIARDQWQRAADMCTQQARKKYSYEFNKDNMKDRLGTETTQIKITSNVAQSADTYNVTWEEEVFSINGTLKDKYTMVGSFTLENGTVKNEEAGRENPMGIFFSHFSWAKEMR